MYRHILVPLDGSLLAEQALPLAKMLAARFAATVTLFQAIVPIREHLHMGHEAAETPEQIELRRSRAATYLEKARADMIAAGITTKAEVRVGAAATAILEFAESAGVDMITMSTHGRTGLLQWAYGSVADKVLQGSHVPLLLVRVSDKPAAPQPPKRILVPLDGSALAELALDPAQSLAAAFDSEVLLFRSWDIPATGLDEIPVSVLDAWQKSARSDAEEYLASVVHRLQEQGLRARAETQEGAPVESILEEATASAASLIVMSTHGRSGVTRWVLGTTADRVLRSSSVPVLLMRAPRRAA